MSCSKLLKKRWTRLLARTGSWKKKLKGSDAEWGRWRQPGSECKGNSVCFSGKTRKLWCLASKIWTNLKRNSWLLSKKYKWWELRKRLRAGMRLPSARFAWQTISMWCWSHAIILLCVLVAFSRLQWPPTSALCADKPFYRRKKLSLGSIKT